MPSGFIIIREENTITSMNKTTGVAITHEIGTE
jgi:hypothetical protein